MNRMVITLIGISALLGAFACDGSSDSLTDGRRTNPNEGSAPGATAGGEDSTFDHSNDPGAAAPGADTSGADPSMYKVVGSPEVTARLHACGKVSYAALGQLLTSRGMGNGKVPNGGQNGQALYKAGAAALGVANYDGRVPEASFASTSAMSKMFDIFSMSSYDVAAGNWSPPACPGVKLVGPDGKFTKDSLSCLMGKPAKDEHVAIANDAIAKNPTDGPKIAVAAILSAAHTCQ